MHCYVLKNESKIREVAKMCINLVNNLIPVSYYKKTYLYFFNLRKTTKNLVDI